MLGDVNTKGQTNMKSHQWMLEVLDDLTVYASIHGLKLTQLAVREILPVIEKDLETDAIKRTNNIVVLKR